MITSHDAWLARQHARWLCPNAHLFARPDAQRFLRPDWKHFVQPGFAPPAVLSLPEGKANFNPGQPRVPKGNPDGGQWTDAGGSSGGEAGRAGRNDPRVLSDATADNEWRPGAQYASNTPKRPGPGHNGGPPLNEPPEIPQKKPAIKQEQNAVVKALARYIDQLKRSNVAAARIAALIDAVIWLDKFQRASLDSYQDPPGTLEDLQRAAQEGPKLGYERHHLRMKKPAQDDGYPDSMIESPENIVLIPYWKHREITGWYNQKNKDPKYNGLSPIEYLRGKSWDERGEIGLEALRLHRVLKP